METEQVAEEQARIHYEETTQAEPAKDEDSPAIEEATEQKFQRQDIQRSRKEDRSSFAHGLSVGLGIGCIATFVIMWVTVLFIPQMPAALTYEKLLSIFIYPLIYLLVVGLVALTAGIVREYYVRAKD
jgi:cation transport ATPase